MTKETRTDPVIILLCNSSFREIFLIELEIFLYLRMVWLSAGNGGRNNIFTCCIAFLYGEVGFRETRNWTCYGILSACECDGFCVGSLAVGIPGK